MVAVHIPPPDSRELLPPLLACLATATASTQPPPALLSLLSPILRQRVQLLASDDWLSLLCWDNQIASNLPWVISKINVEPHPASGEIEVQDPDEVLYRRSDPETLHARLILGEYNIVPTYLWCTGGDRGSRWELAELRGLEDAEDGTEWFSSLTEANEAGFRRKSIKSNNKMPTPPTISLQLEPTQQDEDDGSYWAAYDHTPSRTPAKRSPMPRTPTRPQLEPSQSELEYFARYAFEVQPALDAHDPDEASPEQEQSTLNGNALNMVPEPETETIGEVFQAFEWPRRPYSIDVTNANNAILRRPYSIDPPNDDRRDSPLDSKPEHVGSTDDDRYCALSHPRPASSASTNSIERLEREAESHNQAEIAIKHHISTDIKSLFRMAKAVGIDRMEFERIVKRELEVLPLLEQA